MHIWSKSLLLVPMLVLFAMFSHTAAAQSRFSSAIPDPKDELKGAQLIAALRQGGHVIYFRHTSTEDARPDQAHCRGSVLSEKGVEEAKSIRKELIRLQIPIDRVMASPVCRTLDSAKAMFGSAEPDPQVLGNRNDFSALADTMTTPHGLKGNLAIVGHYSGSNMIVGSPQLQFGEALVIRPGAKPTLIARLGIADWATLPAAPQQSN